MELFIILILISTSECSRWVYYWDVPPYIWKENGTVKGSIPLFYGAMEKMCSYPKTKYFRIEGGYQEFNKGISGEVNTVMTDQGVKNSSIPLPGIIYWAPYMNTTLGSGTSAFTFWDSGKMAVIVKRSRIQILAKILKGLRRTYNIMAISLFFAMLVGISIWLMVCSRRHYAYFHFL